MWQMILGPVLGAVGGLATKWLDSREKEKDRAHELAVMDREAELADRRLKIEGELRREEAAEASFAASYQFNNERLVPEGAKLSKGQMWLAVFIDALTKSIRPCSTILYQFAIMGIFVWCAVELRRLNIDKLNPDEIHAIFREVIYTIIGTGETILLWWFGIRGTSRKK